MLKKNNKKKPFVVHLVNGSVISFRLSQPRSEMYLRESVRLVSADVSCFLPEGAANAPCTFSIGPAVLPHH